MNTIKIFCTKNLRLLSIIAMLTNVVSCVSTNGSAQNKLQISTIEDVTQVNPLISLRSLETGVPLRNGQYKDDRDFQWIMSEVAPTQTLLKNNIGLTQFKAPDLPRCLYTIQERLITASCDPLDNGSLWRIIPSTLGGVQIKSLRNGLCLSAGDSYSDFRLAECQEIENQTVPIQRLWIFAPPAMPASLAPAFPK